MAILRTLTGASNAVGVAEIAILSLFYYLVWRPAVKAATGQMLSTRSPVDHSHRPAASCDTSLVVSGGVDCGRRRRNVYDKKPQRYAKDNRTAHLTARSNKSVAYVTNNKRLETWRFVLLELTTVRHEASRGLSATADLLVSSSSSSSSTSVVKNYSSIVLASVTRK